MREARRIKILSAVKNIFDIAVTIPTFIKSIPFWNNQNPTF